ncbi:hypothetical protein [Deinococcus carri]
MVLPPAGQAVGIEGHIRNLVPIERHLGQDRVLVLLTNLAGGRIIGIGRLQGADFSIAIPESFRPPVTPARLCPGVRSVPSEPRTYAADALMVYQAGRNTATFLTQADHPTDPTRRAQWLYSDRAATLRGRCTGLSTEYDLTLRAGWNAVMTVSEPGRFLVRNATPGLPYWAERNVLRNVRTLFPAVFDGQ